MLDFVTMPGVSRGLEWIRRHPLPLFLALQGGLLFTRLDLLPIWGDEQFTLDVIRRPWSEIPAVLRADIHPPLYYFLARAWTEIPWPGGSIEQLRALSALVSLLTTVLVDRLWLRRSPPGTRFWFLALWSLSPTLLLYSRMGRSYSLQLLLAGLAMYLAVAFLERPASTRRMVAYASAAGLLLYTHYLPGLAVTAATALWLLVRAIRERSSELARAFLLCHLLLGLLYLPWLATLAFALTRVSEAHPYSLVPNFALETLIKLAYRFTSFTFGESVPVWGIGLGLILGPAVAWSLWRGARDSPRWLSLAWVVGAVGYLGAAAWVTFPFVGARLLFLFPFYLLWLLRGIDLRSKIGRAVLAGLLVVSAGGVSSYFQKHGFLNQGYLVPFGDIAEYIESHSRPDGTLILLDGYNTDPTPLEAALRDKFDYLKIRGKASEDQAREHVVSGRFESIWFLRNTHDISPGRVLGELEAQLRQAYDSRQRPFVPYSAADRWMVQWLGWRHRPSHHYRLLELRRRSAPREQEP